MDRLMLHFLQIIHMVHKGFSKNHNVCSLYQLLFIPPNIFSGKIIIK